MFGKCNKIFVELILKHIMNILDPIKHQEIRQEVENLKISDLIDNVSSVIIGKRDAITLVATALLAGGHVLIEDVPGVGKTQLAASFAKSCGGNFNRISLTPDVMPGDITGFNFFDSVSKQMTFREGAAFCNFLLADEINRSSPKTQSALLEIMEDNQISIDGETHSLPTPFMVLATQNPVETSGTYHLPEAQLDRFLMKISIGYPDFESELKIFHKEIEDAYELKEVLSLEDIKGFAKEASEVRVSESVEKYIVNLANCSRNSDAFALGISPRGCLSIHKAARAYAYIMGRDYVIPDDIKALAVPTLAHRVMLSAKGKSMWQTNETAIEELLKEVKVIS